MLRTTGLTILMIMLSVVFVVTPSSADIERQYEQVQFNNTNWFNVWDWFNQSEQNQNTDQTGQQESTQEQESNQQEREQEQANDQIEESNQTENEQADQSTEGHSFEEQVVNLVNKEREKRGLQPLTLSEELSNVARDKSQDMANQGYFSHQSPTYGSPFDMMSDYGIDYRRAGENIAQGQRSPESVMQGWMNSEGHRENILNDQFTHIGVGYVESQGTTYWTQMFITK
ncbi:CAP domain-containing protein [Alkalibacillus almallahensis]|uniref:CAP domain-containing protein n=1 Tax=Alkalibacillus almallahensis TaxID=1379154 RepID=UPI001422EA51|nr:CAP domain-containing protein [Alkalibacillus almallahensis]NIK11623.1 putative YkwD family protein [Alkalibacillus almallahensis]